MLSSILFTLGLGGACGAVLSVASKVFYVYEDPRIAQVENLTAGANCGGCGYPGCSGAAEAVVAGKAPPSVCILVGPESVAAIAEIVGGEAGTAEARKAFNDCLGGDRATDRFIYQGVNTCNALASLYGGKRDCMIGCLGYGDCIRSCQFNAIDMAPEGFPVVDLERCVGCGACEAVCPKTIIDVSPMSGRLMHLNTDEEALAPCQQTCPAEIDIPRYIDHIRKGEYEDAVNTIRERNPLLLTCGRVCPHPCEEMCRRAIEDDPVSINQLKRFVADIEMNAGKRYPIPCNPDTGKSVAIIGGGPAGLTAAYFLRRMGHHPTIFESMPGLGGMLRYGIPEYRLPKKVLDWEIDGILNLGIDYRVNAEMGFDFDLASLIGGGFDAVFFGVGAWNDYNLGIPGEDLDGCFTGIKFLAQMGKNEIPDIGKRAAVIGGGNTAIDCARTLVRMGLEKVYLVYRRTRKEMPANEVEIVAADHEGIEFVFLAAPNKVLADDNGRVKGLEYLKMELGEPDASGRRRPVPVEGSETVLDIDTIVTAIGQNPDLSFKKEGTRLDELKITRWNTFDVNPETCQTNIPYIFAAGDSQTGPATVVEAIGGARLAARSMDQFLRGKPVVGEPKALLGQKKIEESLFERVEGVQKTKRVEMPELPVKERITTYDEVDLVISEPDALHEANRCLNCCRLCYDPDTIKLN